MEFNHPVGDYHVHPNFSYDAKGSLREYCQKAIELGLAEMIFTTHADSNPIFAKDNFIIIDGKKEPFTADSLRRYRDAVYELNGGNDPAPLMVRCGIEIDYFAEITDTFLKMLEEMHFDFVLCGIHTLDGCNLLGEKGVLSLLQKYSPEKIIEKYYRIAQMACEIELFDSLAHLDVYRRLGMKLYPEAAARIDYPVIDETLEKLVRCNLPIEVNTAGIRHGIGDWYPSRALLDQARRKGVQIGGLGSDAHAPDQLAIDFETAHLLVHETFPMVCED